MSTTTTTTTTVAEPPVLKAYIDDYGAKHEAFKKVAEHLQNVCQTELQSSSVMCNVTSRAKDPARYKVKLQKMLTEKPLAPLTDYKDMDMIETHIQDIIGVRIILYFPSQIRQVVSMLRMKYGSATMDVDVKELTDSDKTPSSAQELLSALTQDKNFVEMTRFKESNGIRELTEYKPRYGSYRAIHVRFELPKVDLGETLMKALGKSRVKVEIQIQSLLMHAWSEVSHDMLYKSLSGNISPQEAHLLDLLNGIGKMGEFVLANLKSLMEVRNIRENGFATISQLEEFMREFASNTLPGSPLYNLGDLEDFHIFLGWVGKNDRAMIQKYLETWAKTKETTSPLVNSILTQILSQNLPGQVSSNKPLEEPFSMTKPFLLPAQNTALAVCPEMGPEIAATIIDLACRSHRYAQWETGAGTTRTLLYGHYTNLRMNGMYDNAGPATPWKPNAVRKPISTSNQSDLKNAVEVFQKVSGPLSSQPPGDPLLQYYCRIARIRAWRIFEKAVSAPVVSQQGRKP